MPRRIHHPARLSPWGAALLTFSLLLAAAAAPAPANEGMWLPHQLDKAPVAKWHERGLELDARAIYSPDGSGLTGAVIHLGGGTGSFVSPRGLIVTNHHVAAGALQRASSVEHNYLEDGFLARRMDAEIPALGYEAFVLRGVEDVTKEVLKNVKPGMDPGKRFRAIQTAEKKIVERTEAKAPVRAEVESVFHGSEYYLYTYFRIRDIRIVYAPPASIGDYGGEIDNWMWPRHGGDFAFFRAYVAPDGSSAKYAKDNVPYQPTHYLDFSMRPLHEGDFTMVIGYPGRTNRNASSYAIDHYVNHYYPTAIKRYEDLLAILDEESARSPEAKIKLASAIQGLGNGYKNNQGMLKGLVAHHLLDKKRQEQQKLRELIASKPDLKKRYGDLFDRLAAEYAGYEKTWERDSDLRYMIWRTSALSSAYTIYNWAVEKVKSDADRDARYMPRDEDNLKRRLALADRRYDEKADERILAYFIEKLATIPSGEPPAFIREICGDRQGDQLDHAVQAYVEKLYAGTKVTDKDARMAMFGKSAGELHALKDPMIEFAAKLEAEMEAREKVDDAFRGAMEELMPRLIALRAIAKEAAVYPDANGTMRISTGEIKGYSPRDAVWYLPETTLSGVVAKNTGKEPFDCPKKLLELYQKRDFGPYEDPTLKDVPVDFLTTDDITGGNSGSPVFNGKGEVIGLAFDGNYESISADYEFVPATTRCIGVDSRYILFVLDKFAGARELLDELTTDRRASR